MHAGSRTASQESLQRRAAKQAEDQAKWLSSLSPYDRELEALRPPSANRSPEGSDAGEFCQLIFHDLASTRRRLARCRLTCPILTGSEADLRKRLGREHSLAAFSKDKELWAGLDKGGLQKALTRLPLTPQQQVPTPKKVSGKSQTVATLRPPPNLRSWWANVQNKKQPLGELAQMLGKKIKDVEGALKTTHFGAHNPVPSGMPTELVAEAERHRRRGINDELALLRQKLDWVNSYLAETQHGSSSKK